MESIIERFDTQHTGILSKGEFVQIMAKSIPLVDKESTESLYTLAEDEFGIDQVANGRLVMIGAFLIVLTAYQQNWTGDIVITRYGLDSLD